MSLKQKKIAALKVIEKIGDQHILLLGSGSTVNLVIDEISQQLPKLLLVSSSRSTSFQIKKFGLTEISVHSIQITDGLICVDGADQIVNYNDKNYFLKGHGAAFVQEKIIWSLASKIFVVADTTKIVENFSTFLPIEIIKESYTSIENQITNLRPKVDKFELRGSAGGIPLVSDNGNLIVDLYFEDPFDVNQALVINNFLNNLPGLVDHGLFLNEFSSKTELIIGSA